MQGEDRHFCLRAESLHLKMVASGWPDIFHIYHRPEDEALIPEMLERLGRSWIEPGQMGNPRLGDLVSLDLSAMEPLPMPNGHLGYPPAQQVRGRLGRLALHPELEQAILSMERGEDRIVPVHFGLDYPLLPYRSQRRLIKVKLIDHKPFGFQPTIEEEIIQNDIGTWVDTTRLEPGTIEMLRELHA